MRSVHFLFLFFFLFSHSAFPYAELARHGYANCVTCHYSPTGGGLLTEYGRALSREVLSSAGNEKEGDFLYGLIKPPPFLALGGDIRPIQTVASLGGRTTTKFIFMQADAEAAVDIAPVTIVGTGGVD